MLLVDYHVDCALEEMKLLASLPAPPLFPSGVENVWLLEIIISPACSIADMLGSDEDSDQELQNFDVMISNSSSPTHVQSQEYDKKRYSVKSSKSKARPALAHSPTNDLGATKDVGEEDSFERFELQFEFTLWNQKLNAPVLWRTESIGHDATTTCNTAFGSVKPNHTRQKEAGRGFGEGSNSGWVTFGTCFDIYLPREMEQRPSLYSQASVLTPGFTESPFHKYMLGMSDAEIRSHESDSSCCAFFREILLGVGVAFSHTWCAPAFMGIIRQFWSTSISTYGENLGTMETLDTVTVSYGQGQTRGGSDGNEAATSVQQEHDVGHVPSNGKVGKHLPQDRTPLVPKLGTFRPHKILVYDQALLHLLMMDLNFHDSCSIGLLDATLADKKVRTPPPKRGASLQAAEGIKAIDLSSKPIQELQTVEEIVILQEIANIARNDFKKTLACNGTNPNQAGNVVNPSASDSEILQEKSEPTSSKNIRACHKMHGHSSNTSGRTVELVPLLKEGHTYDLALGVKSQHLVFCSGCGKVGVDRRGPMEWPILKRCQRCKTVW